MPESNRLVMRLQWRLHKALWNASGGRLGRRVIGMPVVGIVSVGRRTGAERQVLVTDVDDGGSPAIVGTNAGRDVDPAWLTTCELNPTCLHAGTGAGTRSRPSNYTARSGSESGMRLRQPTRVMPTVDLTRPVPILRLEPRG